MNTIKEQETTFTLVTPSDVEATGFKKFTINVSFISSTEVYVYAADEEHALALAEDLNIDEFCTGDLEYNINDAKSVPVEEALDYVTSDDYDGDYFKDIHQDIINEYFDGEDWTWKDVIGYWCDSDIEDAIELYKEQV